VEKPWEFTVMNGILMIPRFKYKMENVNMFMACFKIKIPEDLKEEK
jgi:hypothetical protein